MVEPLRHRQTKGAETDMPGLPPPRHFPTLPWPGGTTGPLLVRAMREGEVTAIIGVPRLYDALWTAIETRVTTRGATVRLIWRALLKSASVVQRSTGLRLGRLLFAPIRRGIVARLRLLVSGGARLEQGTEARRAT